MEIKKSEKPSKMIKIEMVEGDKVLGRTSLFLIFNDLHPEPYGLMEDVFVDESLRGQGIGSQLVKIVIEEAKKLGCRKLIAQSRHSKVEVHRLYEKLGFKNHGLNFRMDLI